MKGSPFSELALVVFLGVLLIFPLWKLTGAVKAPAHTQAHPQTVQVQEEEILASWLEFRCSHAPLELKIYQGETLLWEGDKELNQDVDLDLRFSEGRNQLDFVFRWPETVEQAWVEVKLEAGSRALRETGFWSAGEDRHRWLVEWEDEL